MRCLVTEHNSSTQGRAGPTAIDATRVERPLASAALREVQGSGERIMKKLISVLIILPIVMGAVITLPGNSWADCHEEEPPCTPPGPWWNAFPETAVCYFPIVQADDGSAYIVDRDNRIWFCKDNVCHPASLADVIQ